jgi:nickel transport protein
VRSHKVYPIVTARWFAACSVTLVALCLMSIQAQAHKVNVFAYVEGDKVVVQGYFSGNAKAMDCPVEVYDEGGKKVHEGKTDRKGEYSFKLADLPAFSGSLRIVLEAGMGHKAECTLSAADIPSPVKQEPSPKDQAPKGESAKEQPPREQPRPKDKSEEAPSGPAVAGSTPVMEQAALTAALETAIDKKLEPVIRMLGKQERLLLEQQQGGPKMTDIVGGIGWIMGLAGIAAFLMSRGRSPKT